MAYSKTVTVKGANVRIDDFLLIDGPRVKGDPIRYGGGFIVDTISVLSHGSFGAVLDVAGHSAHGQHRVTLFGTDRVKVERAYA